MQLGTKRRMPSELMHRFNSKEDFITYFGTQLQMYVPPKAMINKGKPFMPLLKSLQIFCDRC